MSHQMLGAGILSSGRMCLETEIVESEGRIRGSVVDEGRDSQLYAKPMYLPKSG